MQSTKSYYGNLAKNTKAVSRMLCEGVRPNLRRLVRRLLGGLAIPPDKRERATQTVLEQDEVLSER